MSDKLLDRRTLLGGAAAVTLAVGMAKAQAAAAQQGTHSGHAGDMAHGRPMMGVFGKAGPVPVAR